ncbi:TSC2 [Auxenochlorella protothecoides x Auxenochlorella symbiontica]
MMSVLLGGSPHQQWATGLAGQRRACSRMGSQGLASYRRNSSHDGSDITGPDLYLYDTATRQKRLFTVRDPDRTQPGVDMYVCGVTVYDFSHIGHARVYVAFDILYRFLLDKGYPVRYVRNFTDIDDKIIKRARETGEHWQSLTQRFIDEFHTDMEALNCLHPVLEPRVTDNIPAIISMIQSILRNEHAYCVDGDVYFEVATLPQYGALSGRKQEDNRAGERVDVDGRKRGPADFVLWKAAKPGEPAWDSPWGQGRPGWHIECSAMIASHFGEEGIDIHGGGRDLIFPHHENERAQTMAATRHSGGCGCETGSSGDGRELARYWMHNGFVNVDSEKMSKSLGNFFTIRDILGATPAAALRWFLLSTHYRAPLNFTPTALDQAADRVYYVFQTLADAEAAARAHDPEVDLSDGRPLPGEPCALLSAVRAALADDLNTPAALAALGPPLRELNELAGKRGKGAAGRQAALLALRASLVHALRLLGLLGPAGDAGAPDAVLAGVRALALKRAGLTEADVAAAVERRAALRAARDFAAADGVRTKLAARGVALMDGAPGGGTQWRPLPLYAPGPSS